MIHICCTYQFGMMLVYSSLSTGAVESTDLNKIMLLNFCFIFLRVLTSESGLLFTRYHSRSLYTIFNSPIQQWSAAIYIHTIWSSILTLRVLTDDKSHNAICVHIKNTLFSACICTTYLFSNATCDFKVLCYVNKISEKLNTTQRKKKTKTISTRSSAIRELRTTYYYCYRAKSCALFSLMIKQKYSVSGIREFLINDTEQP